jgi:hypothetical protein
MAQAYTKIGCRKCGGFVTAHGLLCARCNSRGDGIKTLLLALIAGQGIAVVGLYYWNGLSKRAPREIAHVVDDGAPTAAEVAARGTHRSWFYYVTRDERLDDTMRHARLTSAGDAAGTLELRASGVYGRSAVLTLDRKPSDRSAEEATLAVTFDDRPAEQFVAQETADDAAFVVAVSDYAKFASDMQGAHTMVVDAQLGAKTERVLKFQVAGLTW